MNQKQLGAVLILIGIVLASLVYLAKTKEDKYINEIVLKNNGSCFLDDGSCLHADRNYGWYITGGILAGALIVLGIYLVHFNRTEQLLKENQEQVTHALEEVKHKDEFSAFLAGLSEDEQKIIKAVYAQDGIKQSTLRYKTGLSKATLSLVLKDLEKKGIISKKAAGKTNQVYLIKKF